MTDLTRKIIAGTLGGAAGTLAMHYYWKAATALTGEDPRTLTRERPPDELDDVSVAGEHHEEGESSTAAVGRIAHESTTGESPPPERKAWLSQTVHWTYGSAMGGVYGVLHDARNGLDMWDGMKFGSAMWVLGDEGMVPLLGLSEGPTAYPVKQHVHRLGAHLVYGGVAAMTTKALLAAMAPPPPRRWAWGAAKTYAAWKALKAAGRAGANLFRNGRA